MKDQMSTQLPKGKTIVAVFADFMRYLFDSTKELFKASEPNGELRWESVSKSIELVLAHPNGWGGHSRRNCEPQRSKQVSFLIPLLDVILSDSLVKVKRVLAFALLKPWQVKA